MGGPGVIKKKRRDRNLDSYRVRYSKHYLMSHFKVDYELIPGCFIDLSSITPDIVKNLRRGQTVTVQK
jgi:hypothetical protein